MQTLERVSDTGSPRRAITISPCILCAFFRDTFDIFYQYRRIGARKANMEVAEYGVIDLIPAVQSVLMSQIQSINSN
jgi:hypothetical protein